LSRNNRPAPFQPDRATKGSVPPSRPAWTRPSLAGGRQHRPAQPVDVVNPPPSLPPPLDSVGARLVLSSLHLTTRKQRLLRDNANALSSLRFWPTPNPIGRSRSRHTATATPLLRDNKFRGLRLSTKSFWTFSIGFNKFRQNGRTIWRSR